ncbi:MAG: hypothetical protein GY767_02970 [Shimia sp.]|nr:hypothetical protein [Shimia sp.]
MAADGVAPEESERTKYWLLTLPADTKLKDPVKLAKHRWIIERDYEELKQELGLGHYEERGSRGFHHYAMLCTVGYGFLVAGLPGCLTVLGKGGLQSVSGSG